MRIEKTGSAYDINNSANLGISQAREKETNETKDGFVKSEVKEQKTVSSALELFSKRSKDLGIKEKTVQYADGYGRIKHLALNFTGYADSSSRSQIMNAYKVMFKEMEPDTKFTIVVDREAFKNQIQDMIKDNEIPNPDRFQFILPEKSKSLTIWARDMMLTTFDPQTQGKNVILQQYPLHNWHQDDYVIPPAILAANPEFGYVEDQRLITDGGDVASNTKQSFVGYYSIGATAKKLSKMTNKNKDLRSRAIQYFQEKYDKEVVQTDEKNMFPYEFVPKEYPMKVHRLSFDVVDNPDYKPLELKENQVREGRMYEDLAVELFEARLGKPVMVLGKDDPSTPQVETPASDHLDMGFTPVDDNTCMLGDPKIARDVFRKMTPERLAEVEEILSRVEGEQVDLKSYVKTIRKGNKPYEFDAYEKQLKNEGYNVVRVPHEEPRMGWPYISYNNCLMENFEKDGKEVKRVFLPVYGVKELDSLAVKAYEDQGFEVHTMKMDSVSRKWGALRCISNWLEKSPRG
jgi:hypothetical protein